TTLMPIHHHESAAPLSNSGPATSACIHPSIANAVPCPSSRCASIHATTPCHTASPKLASANVDGAWPNASAAAAQVVSPPINSRASAWLCSAASSSARSSRQAETTLAPSSTSAQIMNMPASPGSRCTAAQCPPSSHAEASAIV